jgi:predicted DNA-binding transcriptional regulator AlpA
MSVSDNEGVPTCLLKADQVAAMLQVSVRNLWRLRSRKQMPQPLRVGNSVRWIRTEIENWIAKRCPNS